MSLKKGLAIFLLLAFAVSGGVLFFSVDRSSFDIFRNADLRYVAAALGLVVIMWLLDASKLYQLVRAAGERITFWQSLKLTWINYFGAALTPMQSGGGPFQMYLMYKNGISVGKTVAITLVRTFISIIILGMAVPFALLLGGELPPMGMGMKGFLMYVGAAVLLAGSAFLLSIFRPKTIKGIVAWIISKLERSKLIKHGRFFRVYRRVAREIDAYRTNIISFATTGRLHFLGALALGYLQMFTYLSVMPCMMAALGYSVPFVHCLLMQALFIFVLYFVPTPGGSGAAEGGAVLVANVFVPWNAAGMIGIGWRVMTEYTGIVLGTIVALRYIGWALANQIAGKSDSEAADAAKAGER